MENKKRMKIFNPMFNEDVKKRRLETIKNKYPNWGDFNKGIKRPDLVEKMKKNNPMKNKDVIEKHKKTWKENYDKGLIKIWSKGTKGMTNPWKNKKHHTEETKRKLSIIHKGMVMKPETKEKIRKASTGRKHTQESKDKIGLSKIGKSKSKESKTKQGNTMKRLYKEGKIVNYYLGKNHKEETKIKIGLANKGKKFPKDKYPDKGFRKSRKYLVLPKKDTKIEVKIQNFLKELGIEYFTHQYINIEHAYQCDIFIPHLNLVIECDGVYWHKYPVGLERDHIRTKELIEKGFKVLRLWENEIKIMDINKFKNLLLV